MSKERDLVSSILRSLPVANDSVLLVHSAIRRLSHEGYRAEGLIEAMMEHLSDGTLLMPTMTWKTVTPENPVWSELATPSHTGMMTEIFRTQYATHRSLHPTHSVAGHGAAAKYLLSGHHLGTTPAPSCSPYGLIRDFPAYILLLDVGMEMCTAIHHPEELIARDIYVEPIADPKPYALMSRDGKLTQYRLYRHTKLRRDFEKFHSALLAAGMTSGTVDGTSWSLIPVPKLMKIIFKALIYDRRATIET